MDKRTFLKTVMVQQSLSNNGIEYDIYDQE